MAKTKPKGFKTTGADQGTINISFAEDHRLYGLEIEIQRRVPVGVLMAGNDLGAALRPLVKRIVSWNLTDDDDAPVKPSIEAFGEHFDLEETQSIVEAWGEAMTKPGGPLSLPSKGTAT